MTDERDRIATVIGSYVACADLEQRPVDWMEIRDALANDGHGEVLVEAAISDYLARLDVAGDLRQTAWALLVLAMQRDPDHAWRWDRILRDFEDDGAETAAWQQAVRELRDMTLTKVSP